MFICDFFYTIAGVTVDISQSQEANEHILHKNLLGISEAYYTYLGFLCKIGGEIYEDTDLAIYHCSLCLDVITGYGSFYLILYDELCSYYIKNGPYPLDPFFEPYLIKMVRVLEKSGYLVSRDVDGNIILVRPLGHKMRKGEHYFCSRKYHFK